MERPATGETMKVQIHSFNCQRYMQQTRDTFIDSDFIKKKKTHILSSPQKGYCNRTTVSQAPSSCCIKCSFPQNELDVIPTRACSVNTVYPSSIHTIGKFQLKSWMHVLLPDDYLSKYDLGLQWFLCVLLMKAFDLPVENYFLRNK